MLCTAKFVDERELTEYDINFSSMIESATLITFLTSISTFEMDYFFRNQVPDWLCHTKSCIFHYTCAYFLLSGN